MSNIASALGGALNANEHDTTDNTQPVPPGDYPLIVEKAELRDTKAGTGKYVWIQTSITGDKFNGRKVFANFNILNPNSEAERIGRADLAKLALAVGLPTVQDTSELIDKCFIGRLKVKDNDNEIAGFKSISGAAPSQPASQPRQSAPAQSAPPAAAPAAKKKMPWEK
jgi:hypothetical protein